MLPDHGLARLRLVDRVYPERGDVEIPAERHAPPVVLACCERCLLEVKNAICSLGRSHVCLLSVFGPAPYRRSARSAASCRCRWVSLEYVSATSF